MQYEENPYYEQWRDAVVGVAKAQWALDVGQASHLDVELATARYDRLDALLHGAPETRR